MYNAEASFGEERVNEFLRVAKDLDIKEIAENIDLTHESSNGNVSNVSDQESYIITERQNENHENINIVPPTSRQNSSITMGKAHQCDQCNYKTALKSNLKIHIESVHVGIKYPCNQCEYKAPYVHSLKRHIDSVHEGIKYPCDQCDYKATQKANLKMHVQAVHGGLQYRCNQCEYKATQKSDLNRHIKFQHRE